MEISVPVKTTIVVKPFIELVRLVAMSFFDDYIAPSNNQKKSTNDNKGIAMVVLNALTRRQWVSEDDLAMDLRLGSIQMRKVLRHFEEEKLVTRHDKKERAKPKPGAATTYGQAEDKYNKLRPHSYWCLHYSQVYDIVRLKLHRIRKKLKDEQEDKNTVQEYGCPKCKRKYSALEALSLISMEDDSFHCEKCNTELVVECNNLTSEDGGKTKDLLQKFEAQMKPLMDQIKRVKDLPVPKFELFPEWEARAAKAARENPNDPSRSLNGAGSTPMPFLGETEVEVNLGEGTEDDKSKGGDSSLKVLPPWMIKSGMNLTDEQRGEMRQEEKVDDKKSAKGKSDDADLKDEYLKAYMAALLQQQELAKQQIKKESEGELETSTTSSERQVGMKAKHEGEDEDEEDVEWVEEAPVVGNENSYMEEGDDDEDDVWEEG